nr:hypothetical protein [Tanacetum cinerariifolium]
MSKAITLILIVALLLSSTLSYDARSITTIPKAATSAPTTTITVVTKSENKDAVDESCEAKRIKLFHRIVTNISVASKLSHEYMGSSLHRSPRGGAEQAQFSELCSIVEGTFLPVMRDRWVWTLEGSIPIKVNVYAWKVTLDCLPTRIDISCRGMEIDSILCPNCGKAAESTSHIFFACSMVREL